MEKQVPARTALIAAALAGAAACRSAPLEEPLESPWRPPPEATLGEVMLLEEGGFGPPSAVAIAHDGRAHVIALVDGPGMFVSYRMHRVVVGRDGVERVDDLESLGWGVWNQAPSATLAPDGALLVAVGRDLFRVGETRAEPVAPPAPDLSADPWWSDPPTWSASFARVASAGDAVIYAARADGEDLGAPMGWNWHAAGGYGGFAVVPWPHYPQKLVLARESAERLEWAVFDAEEEGELGPFAIVADERGSVHVAYALLGADEPVRYARLAPAAEPSSTAVAPDEDGTVSLPPLRGTPLHERVGLRHRTGLRDRPLALSVDPRSGAALVAVLRPGRAWYSDVGALVTRTVVGDEVGPPLLLAEDAEEACLVPDGRGGHFALTLEELGGFLHRSGRVCLRQYSDGAWSAPLVVGEGSAIDALAAADDGRLLVAWRDEKRLLARWVVPTGRKAPP